MRPPAYKLNYTQVYGGALREDTVMCETRVEGRTGGETRWYGSFEEGREARRWGSKVYDAPYSACTFAAKK